MNDEIDMYKYYNNYSYDNIYNNTIYSKIKVYIFGWLIVVFCHNILAMN